MTWAQYRVVLRQDPCVYCHAMSTGLDHIQPKSRGGGDGWKNRAPACHWCDSRKGNTPLLLYLVTMRNIIERVKLRLYRRKYKTDEDREKAFDALVENELRRMR